MSPESDLHTAAAPGAVAQAYPAMCRLIESRLGLSMARGTLPGALEQYIARKKSELAIADEATLAAMLTVATGPMLEELVDAVTVPYSWLFRDYEQLADAVDALEPARPNVRPLQVWVPACAGGEDAYSIAAVANLVGKQVEVLATDVSARVIGKAKSARFGAFSVRSIPPRHRHQLVADSQGQWTLSEDICASVQFIQHNLMVQPPRSQHPSGEWDLIICRNVFIYFARTQMTRALGHLRQALGSFGLLVLGASDILLEPPLGLSTVDLNGRLAFRKSAVAATVATGGRSPGAEQDCRAPNTDALERLVSVEVRAQLLDRSNERETPNSSKASPTLKRVSSNDGNVVRDTESEMAASNDLLDGVVYYLSGDLANAAQRLRSALFYWGELWPAAYYLALCYEELGRLNEAQREYRRTVDLIGRGVALPTAVHHDYSFLERDIVSMARQRAAAAHR